MLEFNTSEFNPSQIKLLEDTSPFVLLCAGFGSGKTTIGIIKALQLKGANGALPGLIVAQTYGALWSNIVDPMLSIFEDRVPRKYRPKIKERGGSRPRIVFADGCKIYLGTAENPKGYDGLSVAWLWMDEGRHASREAWEIAIARVRLINAPLIQRVVTSTPAINWMDEEFNNNKPNRTLIQCGTAENAHNLPPDYIENLKLSYSPRMQRAVLNGEFSPLEGAVFDEFDPAPDSPWMTDFVPTRSFMDQHKVMLAVDPGFRKSAWLFIVQTGDMEWVVFDEIMPDGVSDMTCVRMVNERKYPIDEIWCDPAGDNTQSLDGLDTFAALREIEVRGSGPNGAKLRPIRSVTSFRSIAFGVDKLRVLLGGYEGLPIRVKFSRSLLAYEKTHKRGIVHDLAALSYPELRNGKPTTDIPLKDGVTDHSTDALRYWAVGMWMVEPKLRSRDKEIIAMQGPGYRIA